MPGCAYQDAAYTLDEYGSVTVTSKASFIVLAMGFTTQCSVAHT